MNILLLMDVLPSQYSGGTVRIENIFNEFSKKHRIYFVYIGNNKIEPGHRDIFEKFCVSLDNIELKKEQSFAGRILNILQLKHGGYAKNRFKLDYYRVREKLEEFIKNNKIDVVHVFTYFAAQYVKDIEHVVKIWDVADSYSLEMKRRAVNMPWFAKISLLSEVLRLFNYEKEMINSFSTTIFVSQKDADVYKKTTVKNRIHVIPNGVDLDYFMPKEESAEYFPSLIFTGHMSFVPNIEAVKYFISKIYPSIKRDIPAVKFYIVGCDVTEEILLLKKADVVVTGKVDDIRPFLARSTVFVNPMVSGVGIKNKVLQAMSAGKAIVSTLLGAESVSVTDNYDILLVDDPEEFANKVVRLINDKKLRMSLGINARKTIENKYSWQHTRSAYDEMFNLLLNPR